MKAKELIFTLLFFAILSIASAYFALHLTDATDLQTVSVAVKNVDPSFVADGQIHSQNEATLHFQTAGKLASLPVKEGDTVSQGQTIAQLDTYALQKSLQLAANNYEISKNSADQIKENNQAGVVEGQQRLSLDTSNKNSYQNITEVQVVADAVKRFVDNSTLAQNSAQLNIDLANYALQLATLTSPINGVLTQEDVTVANQNISPATSFVVADPTDLVFRANIPASEIEFINEGSSATIHLDGSNRDIVGTILKIYPQRQTLPTGEDIYQVDIQSAELSGTAKLGQSGSVVISTNTGENVTMVPTWAVLSHNYVWVLENNNPVLKKVTVGKTHESYTEVTGLNASEKVIMDPQGIADKKYQLL